MDNKNNIKSAILDALMSLRDKTDPSHFICELAKQIDIYEEEFPTDDLLIILIALRDSLLYTSDNITERWHTIKDTQYAKIHDILNELFFIKINDVLVTDKLIELEKLGIVK